MKANISLGDALRLGSAVVPVPHSSQIESCGVGMVYAAHGVRSLECGTINLLYPVQIDKIWPCAWCGESELIGASVVQHPFMLHYLTGEIELEDLAGWLDFLFAGREPGWKQINAYKRALRERRHAEEAEAEVEAAEVE